MCQNFLSLSQGVHSSSLFEQTPGITSNRAANPTLRLKAREMVARRKPLQNARSCSIFITCACLLSEGLPQRQCGRAEKVMLWGEGVPRLPPAWPGGAGSGTDISSRSRRSQPRRRSRCQEKQPAARGGVRMR